MLDAMKFNLARLDSKRLRDAIRDTYETALRESTIHSGPRHLKRISRFAKKSRPRIARHREDTSLRRPSRRFHHVSQCLLGKSCAMLDAVEALLFGGRDQSSVTYECRTGIAMVRVDTDDTVHEVTIR